MQVFLIAISLAMDAFAVALCKGLKMNKINYNYSFILASSFGIFQAIMPLVGWIIGISFAKYITNIGHIISFVLLTFVGGKMIQESFENNEDNVLKYDFKEIILLAIATSIDALAVGVTFAFNEINLFSAVTCIGIVAFVLSLIGVIIGNKFGIKYKNKAEILGGSILIFLGCKFLFF